MRTFKDEKEWFRAIHQNIPVGVFRSTPDGRLLSANPAMAAIHGYRNADEMMQVPIFGLYGDPNQGAALLAQLEKEEKVPEIEIRFKRKDGAACWGALTVRRTVAPDGTVHIDGIVRDISGRKGIEAALARAHQELDNRVRERTAELSEANDRLQQEVGEKERLHQQLIVSQKNLALANVDLEKAILNANQMAADAEVRNYELEIEIEKRKRSEAALKESENRYRTIIESIEDGYFEIDLNGNFTYSNDAMCRILGYGRRELAAMKNTDILRKAEQHFVVESFASVLRQETPLAGLRFDIVRKNGSKRHVEASISPVKDAGGGKIGFRGIVRDVEERRKYEKRLVYFAYHDPLTDLKNRKAFYERLDESIAYAQRYQTEIAIIYIDIDRFKQVNDTLGHEKGDALLCEIASRLKASTRRTDFPARLGGDEFAVILNNPGRTREGLVAKRILAALSRPYDLQEHRVDYISASIGTARFPSDATGTDPLIKCADLAMYQAKKSRNGLIPYEKTTAGKKKED